MAKDNTQWFGNSDFLNSVKNTFSNTGFWAPALAATLGAGVIGGLGAFFSKRKIETPRQRRRRILRSILVPTLLTAGAAGLGGLGYAALNMKSLNYSDPSLVAAENFLKKQKKKEQKERDENLETAGSVLKELTPVAAGTGAFALTSRYGPRLGNVIKNYAKDNVPPIVANYKNSVLENSKLKAHNTIKRTPDAAFGPLTKTHYDALIAKEAEKIYGKNIPVRIARSGKRGINAIKKILNKNPYTATALNTANILFPKFIAPGAAAWGAYEGVDSSLSYLFDGDTPSEKEIINLARKIKAQD